MVKVMPGIDSLHHTNSLQSGVVKSLNQMNQPVSMQEVAPSATQGPLSQDVTGLEKPSTENDFFDTILGLKGKPRTERSFNFLKLLIGRIKKKNPGSELKEE